MKTQCTQYAIRILLLSLIAYVGGVSQTHDISDKWGQQPIGVFRQVTDVVEAEMSDDYINSIVLDKESDVKDRRWTLRFVDEVDPAYKFEVLRGNSQEKNGKRNEIIQVTGKLVAPSGKWFEFTQATYDFASRKLRFTTVERDGIKYEAEVRFYSETVFVKGTFVKGVIKLKALGKSVGHVSFEFKFTSWNNT